MADAPSNTSLSIPGEPAAVSPQGFRGAPVGDTTAARALEQARRLWADGLLDEAMDALDPALAAQRVETENHAQALELQARIAFAQGRAELAEGALRQTINGHGATPALATSLGAARLAEENVEGARRAFEHALGLDSRAMVAAAGLAEVQERQGRQDEALETLRMALAAALSASGAVGEAALRQSLLPVSLADALARLADTRAAQGDNADAERLYLLALTGNGTCGPALVGLGALKAKAGDGAGAEALYRRALEQGTAPVEASLAMARLKDEEGREGVAAVLREAAGLAARTNADLIAVGDALATAGQYRSAAAAYARVVRADPANARARRGLVRVLGAEGEREEAMMHVDRALALDADAAWPHAEKGWLLMGARLPVRAIAAFRDALARAPGDAALLRAMAQAQSAVGQDSEAIATYHAVLAFAPGDGQSRSVLADLLEKRRLVDMARTLRAPPVRLPESTRANRPPPAVMDVIGRVSVLRGLDPARIRCEPLSSGGHAFAHSYRLRVGEADLRVRLGTGDRGAGARADEARNLRLAATLGLTPPPLFFDPNDGAVVHPFVIGRALTPDRLGDRSALTRVARAYARLHGSRLGFRGTFDLPGRVVTLGGYVPSIPGGGDVAAVIQRLLPLMASTHPKPVPIHNAPFLEGIIDSGRQVVFIDWQASVMGDPHGDLAGVINEGCLDQAGEEAFLAAYFGRHPPPNALARIRAFRLLLAWAAGLAATANEVADEADMYLDICLSLLNAPWWDDVLPHLHATPGAVV